MPLGRRRTAVRVSPRRGKYRSTEETKRRHVDFFLLQDLVSDDYGAVRFFMPFNDFSPTAIPRNLDTYLEFRRLSIKFTEARNRRIDQLALDVD